MALRLALEAVVADGARGIQRFLNVALFEDIPLLLRVVRPHSGEEVRLQFQPHGEPVVFDFADALALRVHLVGGAE